MQKLLAFIRWIFGIFVIFIALVSFTFAPLSALIGILISALIIPKTSDLIYSKLPKKLPVISKAGIMSFLILLFVVLGASSSPSSTSPPAPTNLPTPQPTLQVEPNSTKESLEKKFVESKVIPAPVVAATPKPTVKPITQPTIKPTNPPAPKYSCSGPDLDCSDFASHAEAQAFFDSCGFSASRDPMRLDGKDKDGLACED